MLVSGGEPSNFTVRFVSWPEQLTFLKIHGSHRVTPTVHGSCVGVLVFRKTITAIQESDINQIVASIKVRKWPLDTLKSAESRFSITGDVKLAPLDYKRVLLGRRFPQDLRMNSLLTCKFVKTKMYKCDCWSPDFCINETEVKVPVVTLLYVPPCWTFLNKYINEWMNK